MTESDEQLAVRIARSILDGSMQLLLGCRQMIGPIRRLGLDHQEPFITFIGVESETDSLPLESEDRKMWNAEALAREDKEIARYTTWAEGLVIPACHEVIRRFNGSIQPSD